MFNSVFWTGLLIVAIIYWIFCVAIFGLLFFVGKKSDEKDNKDKFKKPSLTESILISLSILAIFVFASVAAALDNNALYAIAGVVIIVVALVILVVSKIKSNKNKQERNSKDDDRTPKKAWLYLFALTSAFCLIVLGVFTAVYAIAETFIVSTSIYLRDASDQASILFVLAIIAIVIVVFTVGAVMGIVGAIKKKPTNNIQQEKTSDVTDEPRQ